VGPPQPDYANAAGLIDASRGLGALLAECQDLEQAAGRDRAATRRWGPRPLDLDILIARDVVHRGPTLELPHPRLHLRAFALVPTAEIVPEWRHPALGGTLLELAERAVAADPDAICHRMPAEEWIGNDPRFKIRH